MLGKQRRQGKAAGPDTAQHIDAAQSGWAGERHHVLADGADRGPPLDGRGRDLAGQPGQGLGQGREIAVVIEVPQAEVSAAIAAIRSGAVDLAAVPITDSLGSDSSDAGLR